MPDLNYAAPPTLPIDEDPFQWLRPSARAVPIIERLRAEYALMRRTLLDTVPHSRERSVALTALEESAMWSIKAAVGRIV